MNTKHIVSGLLAMLLVSSLRAADYVPDGSVLKNYMIQSSTDSTDWSAEKDGGGSAKTILAVKGDGKGPKANPQSVSQADTRNIVAFAPGSKYKHSLSDEVLKEGASVRFDFGGEGGSGPENSPVVSVGGATLALKLQSKEGYKSTVRLMVQRTDEEGREVWQQTPLVVLPSQDAKKVAMAANLDLRFHWSEGTWDLYSNDFPLLKAIPLRQVADKKMATLDISGANTEAVLGNFVLDGQPKAIVERQLPTAVKIPVQKKSSDATQASGKSAPAKAGESPVNTNKK